MDIKYKIGYIDEDLNQVKKYQRRFRKFGIEVIGYDFENGMSFEALMKQVYNSDIDLLMIDYKLNETNKVTFNGEAVESDFYDKKPLFPHIIFTNKVEQAEPHVEDWKLIFDKDDIFSEDENDDKKVQHFITTLIKSIEQYKNHIEKKKKTVSELLEKGETELLSTIEKDKIVSIQRELQNLYKVNINEVPEYIVNSKNLDEIEKTRKDAENFLQSLIKKRKK